MCGGRGTRLQAETEKPLYEITGRPMVDRVLDALLASSLETVHAVGSPAVPDTMAHLTTRLSTHTDCRVVEASGDGYVDDLDDALADIDRPVLTVTADLPLLEADALDTVLDEHTASSLSVCVPASLKESLGVSVDTTFSRTERTLAPTGVNVVGEAETDDLVTTRDARFAVNVNYRRDARVAEVLI